MKRRTRVLIADDHQMLVDALKVVLEPRYEVIGTVNNGRALLEAAPTLQPEVIVLDISMPELNGLDAARHLRHSVPKAKLIFLTMHEDPELVGQAFRAGGSAFLLKHAAAFELTEAIEKVLKGNSYLTTSIEKERTSVSVQDPKEWEPAAKITLRQREVIQLLAEGRLLKEVAWILNISRRTVCAHKYAAMERLHLRTNAELVQYAIKQNIISL